MPTLFLTAQGKSFDSNEKILPCLNWSCYIFKGDQRWQGNKIAVNDEVMTRVMD